MPDPATSPHFVSHGPPDTSGGASDWCSATCRTDVREQHVAPGGVVLCKRGTMNVGQRFGPLVHLDRGLLEPWPVCRSTSESPGLPGFHYTHADVNCPRCLRAGETK